MKALHLISDGIDSVVAAHILLEKGYELEFLHYSFGDDALKEIMLKKVTELIKKLSQIHNKELKLNTIDYNIFQKKKIKNYKIHCVLCKRTMLKTAEALSEKTNAEFISNGDSLGQVASQTLRNIEAIDQGMNKIILRPLFVMDKQDIIRISKEIGTYAISIRNSKRCPFLPRKISTKTRMRDIKKAEEEIGLNNLIEEMIRKNECITIKA